MTGRGEGVNTISGHEGPPGPLIREWLPAESRPEVEALVTELKDLERAAIVAEGEEEARLAGARVT